MPGRFRKIDTGRRTGQSVLPSGNISGETSVRGKH